MEETKKLETQTLLAIAEYTLFLGVPFDRIFSAIYSETCFEKQLEEMRAGISSGDALKLRAIVAGTYALLHADGETLSTGEIIEWASAYGYLRGGIREKLALSERAMPGALAKAEKEAKKGKKVIEYMLQIEGSESMNGDKLASEILGRPGVYSSHRKIADTIREARKKQCATHNAQDA